MAAEELLLATPVLIMKSWFTLAKGTLSQTQALVDFLRAKCICRSKCLCVCSVYVHSWMHMYALPGQIILPLWHCREKTTTLKSNSSGLTEPIRSYLCPGKHLESWSPLDCWFQSCSRGQWPAASASAGKRGLWEKTNRVNLPGKKQRDSER